MKPLRRTLAVLVCILASLPLAAAEKAGEIAVFSVPGLSEKAVVKSLTASVAKERGVISGKVDASAGKYLVTFEPAKTTRASLIAAVTRAVPAAKLDKVEAAEVKGAAKPDCGKCPSKSKCDKAS